jgi:DNA-binding transcriptional MerR regulator/methylmalonyl-CoA mutase cobalamin-binding subunit
MPATYHTPIFNLKAVVQKTGVKPDTLRAWERRYGLPQPGRTKGGHRLYSQRDVDIIKWLTARQQEGLNIKRAVELWHRIEADGKEPFQAMPSGPQTAISAGGTIAELRQAWVSACLVFDERGAEQVLAQAFALYSPETVCLELLQKGVARIGRGCYESDVTVQQEHFTSELAMRRVEALVLATPPPTHPARILAACPPEEEHSFSLLLLTYLLRRRGWEVLYLGANVPIERMDTTAKETGPQLVILAAQQLHTAANLLRMAQFLRYENIPPAFGGRIFNRLPTLRARIPGHFLGPSLEGAPQVMEQLMATPRPLPSFEIASEAHKQALAHYRERRSLIEADLLKQKPGSLEKTWFLTANRELARNIIAALALGDVDFLDDSIDWLEGLCSDDHVPAGTLENYLGVYYQAARAHMDERGAPIINWLTEQIDVDE